jgi:signal transduction histidine kinase/CheY-like chemotaxis protein
VFTLRCRRPLQEHSTIDTPHMQRANPTRPGAAVAAIADEPLIQAFVRERFVAMFLSQSQRAQLGLLLAATLVAWVWYDTTGTRAAPVWLAGVALVTMLRIRYSQRWIGGPDAMVGSQRVVWALGLNGVMLAIPLGVFFEFSQLERAAVSIILLGTATASVATTSGYRLVFVAFAAPMLLPLALAWAWVAADSRSGAAWGLALLVAAYLLFLISIARQANQVFEESCRFRHGEQQLTRELTKALDLASEANRAKTQFLAAASHDLRQPIHSMNVLVAALSMRQLEPRSREIVALLESVNLTLSKQLDTLLDVSKLDAGIIKPELQVQPLDHIVRAHHATTAPVASARGIRLELALDAEPLVLTDAALLARTLSNLTDNALKFTPSGGLVRLGLRLDDGQALLQVQDSGIGIPAAEHERVFREFYQVGNVERDRSKGLGLGLSIVRRLCALLNVQLQLHSVPGEGTTVSLRMPLATSAAAPVVPLQPTSTPQGLRVLLVDDEPMVRQSMKLLLLELGCTVHLADSSAQAAHTAAQHGIDIVLSDYRLRDDDSGIAAIAAVQALHPQARAALITGDTAPDRIRDAQLAGVPLLHKPVTLNQLVAVLASRPS